MTSRAVRNEGVAWLPSRRSLRYRAGRALAFTPTQAGRLPCGGIVTERERESSECDRCSVVSEGSVAKAEDLLGKLARRLETNRVCEREKERERERGNLSV